ncbi:MAG TPA: homoserine O-succinyltransferase [Rhodanobacteraceae bacterium]|nr:homoserine O-succinyltransferase [Rhodanobacteraceae bacterium]
MTFHADVPVSDSAACVDAVVPAACVARDDECVVRVAPFHGGEPCDVRVRYALYGAAGAPVIAVQGGISATRHASAEGGREGWWDALVGAGRAIDTRRFRVLSIEWLGPDSFSTCDAIRAIGSEDQADAIAASTLALGIERLHAFVGASYGAMVGIALAARHPAKLRRLVAIAGAHRAHPLAIAVRNVQRAIVRLGARHGDAASGLDLARRLAMTTYRSEREFAERCAAAPLFRDGRYRFAEEDWLEAAGANFSQRFAAERFLALSESIDLHAIAPEDVRVPSTLIGFSSDRLVPLSDLCELQRRCGAPAPLHVIDSRYGHDAFLKEPDRIGPLIAEALDAGSIA